MACFLKKYILDETNESIKIKSFSDFKSNLAVYPTEQYDRLIISKKHRILQRGLDTIPSLFLKRITSMTSAQKLKNLLENELLPDLEIAIDELFEEIDKAKHATKEQKADLEELREMRTECYAIIEEINRDEMDEEEAQELLEEFLEIKTID